MFEILPLFVHDGHVDAGRVAGDGAERAPRPRGGLEQQVAQVVAKHADGFGVGLALEVGAERALEGWREQAVEGIGQGRLDGGCGHGVLRRGHSGAHQGQGIVAVHVHAHGQPALLLAAPDGEHAMGRDGLHGLREVVVHLVLAALALLVVRHLAVERAGVGVEGSHLLAERRVVGDLLGDDVAGAIECGSGVGQPAVGVHEGRGDGLERGGLSHRRQEGAGERLEAPLAGQRAAALALDAAAEIHVLQFVAGRARLDGGAEAVGQGGLLGEAPENRLAALLKRDEGVPVGLELAEAGFIEVARLLATVACEEGRAEPRVEEGSGGLHGGQGKARQRGQAFQRWAVCGQSRVSTTEEPASTAGGTAIIGRAHGSVKRKGKGKVKGRVKVKGKSERGKGEMANRLRRGHQARSSALLPPSLSLPPAVNRAGGNWSPGGW